MIMDVCLVKFVMPCVTDLKLIFAFYLLGKEKEVVAMENGGNSKVNAIFEARLPNVSGLKIQAGADGRTRERYIRDKYERRKYFDAVAGAVVLSGGAEESDDSESSDEEEEVPVRSSVSRATAAAKLRAQNKGTSKMKVKLPPNNNNSKRPPKPHRAPAPAPAQEIDLLDFGSFTNGSVTATNNNNPAPPSQPSSPATVQASKPTDSANSVGDLFGGMKISPPKTAPKPAAVSTQAKSNDESSWTSAFITPPTNSDAMPQKKSNEDILAMFNTPSPAQNQQHMMNLMMMQNQQQMTNMMTSQQQMIYQQNMLAAQNQNFASQQQKVNNTRVNGGTFNAYPQNMISVTGQQAMPQQYTNNQIPMNNSMSFQQGNFVMNQNQYQPQMVGMAQMNMNQHVQQQKNLQNGYPMQMQMGNQAHGFDAQMKQQEQMMAMAQNNQQMKSNLNSTQSAFHHFDGL